MIILINRNSTKRLIKFVLHDKFSGAGFAAFASRMLILRTIDYGLFNESSLGVDAVGAAGEGTEITILDFILVILLAKL